LCKKSSTENNNNSNSSSKPKLPHKFALAANKDRSVIKSSTGLTQNSNNNCSTQPVRPLIVSTASPSTVRATIAAHELQMNQMSNAVHGYRQPPPFVSPSAVARQNALAGRLPLPLVPCPRYTSPAACSSASPFIRQQLVTAKPPTTTPVVNGVHSKQLPFYISPTCHPNAIPRPTGYAVPFCRPVGSQPGLNPRPGVCQPVGMARGGMFPSNGNQHMPTPVGMLQLHLPPSCSNGLPPLRACVSSAPSGIIPPPVCHIVSGRNDVPLISTSSVGVTSAVQPGIVTNGLSPLASLDICVSFNGMALNDDNFSLLQDAIKEEHAAFSVSRNMPADHFPSCSGSYNVTSANYALEISSAESDSSLSDWSIIELPSPSTVSSVNPGGVQDEASVMKQSPVVSLASPSLMQFSLDCELSDAPNPVCGGPLPGRNDQFPAQKLSTACIPQPGNSSSSSNNNNNNNNKSVIIIIHL